jgi:hypothetical protein
MSIIHYLTMYIKVTLFFWIVTRGFVDRYCFGGAYCLRIHTATSERLSWGLAMPWLWRLVAGPSPRSPGFTTGSIHVGFVVDKVALGQIFLLVLVFPCQYHSTIILHTHTSSAGWTICQLVAALQRHCFTPSKSTIYNIEVCWDF